MKELILSSTMNTIKSNYPEYDTAKIEEIRYGLEGIYLNVTKIIFIICLSFVLGIFKETLQIMIFFNIIRFFAFGVHASKSWMCWVASVICFIAGPMICKYILIDKIYMIIILVVSTIGFAIFAPADTEKRPLINKNKRIRNKIFTVITSIAFMCIALNTQDTSLASCIVMATIFGVVSILPITYKIFHLSYNNYKSYNS